MQMNKECEHGNYVASRKVSLFSTCSSAGLSLCEMLTDSRLGEYSPLTAETDGGHRGGGAEVPEPAPTEGPSPSHRKLPARIPSLFNY